MRLHHGVLTPRATCQNNFNSHLKLSTDPCIPTHSATKPSVATSSLSTMNKPASSATKNKTSRKYAQRYPRGVSVDFRTLSSSTLLSYIGHYGLPVSAEAPASELGVAVAQHFETEEINEEQAIGGFLARLEAGGDDNSKPPPSPHNPTGSTAGMKALTAAADTVLSEYVRSSTHFDGQALSPTRRKWKRRKFAANQGDQVAAKVTRSEENGSWILAYV